MRSVLIISRCFPPVYDVGGKRAYRFAKYLPAYGWNATIWAAPIPDGHPVDPLPLGTEGMTIERTLEPRWWPKPYLTYTVSAEAINTSGGFLKRCARACAVPLGLDTVMLPRAAGLLRNLTKQRRFDAVLATSGPPIALIYGWIAHKLTGAPLVLDLRDPWSLSFLQTHKTEWVRSVEGVIELALFNRAARVILTSETAAEAYRQILPASLEDRILTITNSFDPSLRVDRQVPSGPIRVMHFGHSNGTRTLATVLRALAVIRQEGRWPEAGIELINYGRVRFDDLRLAVSLGLDDVVHSHALVGYAEGIATLASADLLLLLGYGDERLYIPAKTFDYLLAGRPILCVAAPSCLTRLVQETGAGRTADPNDIGAVRAAIEAAVAARTGETQFPDRRPEVVERYSALATTRQLAGVLDGAVAERPSH